MRADTGADVVPFVDLRSGYRAISSEIDAAIGAVLESAGFIMGPELEAFEREFADFLGAAHCVGVASGTDALALCLRAAGVDSGDEVIIPANTFIASAMAVSQVGATPRMVDIDDHYLIDTSVIEAAITPRTKAIMPVHLYGQAADLGPLMALAERHKLHVIEDACQAHGARYDGRRVGTFGTAAAFSFYPGKNLGAYGDGGAVVTADPEIAERVRLLRDFGQRKKYEHVIIGGNSRLDSMQAAILRVKLRYLDRWNACRRGAARTYDELLDCPGITRPLCRDLDGHVYHLYVVRVARRNAALQTLAQSGIQAGIHYPVPVHLQPAYAHLGLRRGAYPRTEAAAGEIISLPMFPEITNSQIERVAATLRQHVGGAQEARS